VPGRGLVTIETLGPWTVLGWSWLEPPHRWRFGATARRATSAIEIGARPVRRLIEQDPALGYALTRRFLDVLVDRLQATRLRLLDLYAHGGQVGPESWLHVSLAPRRSSVDLRHWRMERSTLTAYAKPCEAWTLCQRTRSVR
jgi:hypothetical protein